jgi:tricorn protease
MRVVQVSLILVAMVVPGSSQQQTRGYYRFPAIHGQQIVFTSEGDLWQVPLVRGNGAPLHHASWRGDTRRLFA